MLVLKGSGAALGKLLKSLGEPLEELLEALLLIFTDLVAQLGGLMLVILQGLAAHLGGLAAHHGGLVAHLD